MARDKSLPRLGVQSSAVRTGATVSPWGGSDNYRSQGALPRAAPCGANGSGALPAPCVSAASVQKRRTELAVALGYSDCVSSDLTRSVSRSLPGGWEKPAGAVPMDAILSCKPEDLEDYYNLLGCDELSTVRASPSPPASSQLERARVPARNLQLGIFYMSCAPSFLPLVGSPLESSVFSPVFSLTLRA